jgi:type IV pilus assembly protein PilY1
MRDGSWAMIFGNGYDSRTGQAKLFILDARTGSVIREFAVGSAGNNGLGQPNVVLNTSREIIAIYAGDLKGNLWKFDVSDVDASKWNVAFSGSPLFSTSVSGAGNQPITVMPDIIAHPNGGAVVVFGTGKLFESTDTSTDASKNVNLATQSLYGIWDKPGETTGITAARSAILLQQQSLSTGASDTIGSTTTNDPNWSMHRGWYLDLQSGGERANISPQIINSVALMVVNKPIVDPCSNGGNARIIALDAVSGKAPAVKAFANTGNVLIDKSGVVTQPLIQYYNGGADPGATTAPLINDRGQLSGGRSGGVELGRGKAPCDELLSYTRNDTSLVQTNVKTCSNGKGRISWRQLK